MRQNVISLRLAHALQGFPFMNVPESVGRGGCCGGVVLVADDSSEMRTLVSSMLERDGFEIVEASDGVELSDCLGLGATPASRDYDLVITDVHMPRRSGIDVLRALRARNDVTPVILMTAYGDATFYEEAVRLNATMALDKPLSLLALRDAARKLVDPPWW